MLNPDVRKACEAVRESGLEGLYTIDDYSHVPGYLKTLDKFICDFAKHEVFIDEEEYNSVKKSLQKYICCFDRYWLSYEDRIINMLRNYDVETIEDYELDDIYYDIKEPAFFDKQVILSPALEDYLNDVTNMAMDLEDDKLWKFLNQYKKFSKYASRATDLLCELIRFRDNVQNENKELSKEDQWKDHLYDISKFRYA